MREQFCKAYRIARLIDGLFARSFLVDVTPASKKDMRELWQQIEWTELVLVAQIPLVDEALEVLSTKGRGVDSERFIDRVERMRFF